MFSSHFSNMKPCTTFKWNRQWFEPVKDIKINENRNFCLTLSVVREIDREGNIAEAPILSIKRWRRRRDKKSKELFYSPSRGFNIRNEDQYISIVESLQSYSGLVGWEDADEKMMQEIELDGHVKKLLNKDPETSLKILDEIANMIDKNEDITFISKAISVVNSIDRGLMDVLTKLSAETPEALKELDNILDSLSLTQVNAFTRYVQIRLRALDVFSKLITDPKTYEIKGQKESMHRFLENNNWILSENYELLASNKTLKTLILKEVGKRIKGRDRPDFALACLGDMKLVIVEIKKPAHNMTLEDVNQLMRYRAIAEKHMGKKFESFDGYLVGQKCDSDLEANKNGFKDVNIRTYTNVITKTESRYKELLDVYKKKTKSKL